MINISNRNINYLPTYNYTRSTIFQIAKVKKTKKEIILFEEKKESRYLQKKRLLQNKFSEGRWDKKEHLLFLDGILKYGNQWKEIEGLIGNRTSIQIRSHSQKFFYKVNKLNLFNIISEKTSIENLKDVVKYLSFEEYNVVFEIFLNLPFFKLDSDKIFELEKKLSNIRMNQKYNKTIYTDRNIAQVDDDNKTIEEEDIKNYNYMINNLYDDNSGINMKEIMLINHLMEAINDQNNDKNQGILNISSPFYQSRILFENEYETNHDYQYVDRKTYCFNTDNSLNFINSPIDDSFVEASTNYNNRSFD